MGEMASSIAHEVNQPLTAIATYAQACRRLMEGGSAQPPRVMEVLQHIAEEALRAGNIIHRLKDMVRVQESHWMESDLNALIRDVEQLASVDARLHDVLLSFQLAPDLPTILADGVQVQQVVLNLIRNGIDAVEEGGGGGGEVVVRTERVGPKAVGVSVEDNGSGLSPDQEEKLFQPFFTTKSGGMGMGLSISKSIATAHRGRISFSRNPSRGMTFRLTLPTFDER
jgi:signal transduction histidine kinase